MSTSTSASTSPTIIDTTYRLSSPPADTTSPDHDSDSTSSQAQRERERELRRQKKKKRDKGKDKRDKDKDKDKDKEERQEKEQDRLADSRKTSRDRTTSRPSNAESYGSYQVDDLDVDDLNSETHILAHVPSLAKHSSYSSAISSASHQHPHPHDQHHIISIPEHTATTTDAPKSLIERQADEARVQTWLTENGFNAAVRHQLNGYNGADLLQLSKTDCKELLGVKEGIRLYNRLKWTKQAELEPNKQFGGIQPEARSPYGTCDELGCQRGATATCDGAECGRALCTAHSHKYLLTSAIFCRSCYQVSSLSKVVHVVAQQDAAQCIIS